jgi:hypothetical protein
LFHAEKASQDWSTIPASVKINPEGEKRLSDLSRLIVDLRAHLGTAPGQPVDRVTSTR